MLDRPCWGGWGAPGDEGPIAIALGLRLMLRPAGLQWSRDEVCTKLKSIMDSIYDSAKKAAQEYNTSLDAGANIAAFLKARRRGACQWWACLPFLCRARCWLYDPLCVACPCPCARALPAGRRGGAGPGRLLSRRLFETPRPFSTSTASRLDERSLNE